MCGDLRPQLLQRAEPHELDVEVVVEDRTLGHRVVVGQIEQTLLALEGHPQRPADGLAQPAAHHTVEKLFPVQLDRHVGSPRVSDGSDGRGCAAALSDLHSPGASRGPGAAPHVDLTTRRCYPQQSAGHGGRPAICNIAGYVGSGGADPAGAYRAPGGSGGLLHRDRHRTRAICWRKVVGDCARLREETDVKTCRAAASRTAGPTRAATALVAPFVSCGDAVAYRERFEVARG